MVFEGEDKVLEEDLIKKDRKFFPTLMEWISDNNAEQILRTQVAVAAGNVNMFVIPRDETFFMTSCTLSIAKDVPAVAAVRSGSIGTDDGAFTFLEVVTTDVKTADSNSISFPMPIRVEGGKTITLGGATASTVRGSIHGFVLSKKISFRI